MNKTIKNLFEKAGGHTEIEDVCQEEWTYTENLDVEKFADMIVRQCIFELAHESTMNNSKEVQDFTIESVNRIKKRFGVA